MAIRNFVLLALSLTAFAAQASSLVCKSVTPGAYFEGLTLRAMVVSKTELANVVVQALRANGNIEQIGHAKSVKIVAGKSETINEGGRWGDAFLSLPATFTAESAFMSQLLVTEFDGDYHAEANVALSCSIGTPRD